MREVSVRDLDGNRIIFGKDECRLRAGRAERQPAQVEAFKARITRPR
jgi:hypothetical protein